MRCITVPLLLALTACVTTKARHVYVPKSSAACWRECKAMSLTCLNRPGARSPVTSYDRPSLTEQCEDERLDRLLTCPGAIETKKEMESS